MPRERKIIIGLLNQETSHVLILKDKVEFIEVNIKHNFYYRELGDLGITRDETLSFFKSKYYIENHPKRLTKHK